MYQQLTNEQRYTIMSLMKAGYKRLALWLMAVLVAQVSLGISNVVFSLPLIIAVAHNGIAALLLLSLVFCVHYIGLPEKR